MATCGLEFCSGKVELHARSSLALIAWIDEAGRLFHGFVTLIANECRFIVVHIRLFNMNGKPPRCVETRRMMELRWMKPIMSLNVRTRSPCSRLIRGENWMSALGWCVYGSRFGSGILLVVSACTLSSLSRTRSMFRATAWTQYSSNGQTSKE